MTTKSTPPRQRHYLISALLLAAGLGALYLIVNYSKQLQPILPPLAAQRNLEQWLQEDSNQLMRNEPLYNFATVAEIYQRTNYQLLWFNNYQLSAAGTLLLQQLQETSADELRDYHYHTTYLRQRLHALQTTPKEATALDILLSDAFVSYTHDVLNDNLLPDTIEGTPFPRKSLLPSALKPVAFQPPQKSSDIAATSPHIHYQGIVDLVSDNKDPEQLQEILSRMTPSHNEYFQLRNALNFYRELSNHRWRPLPNGPELREGTIHPQVSLLRDLLITYGDHAAVSKPVKTDAFDFELTEALIKFQLRSGRVGTGILDKETRKRLNIHPSQRVKQIALNMKRWRQLPKDLGERYLWVNLTNYNLQLINNDQIELEMRVIVGKSYRQTPVLQEFIRTVVLNPIWNVPRRIALNDILPQVKKNPSYLSDHNIDILRNWNDSTPVPPEEIDWAHASRRNFPYRFRQAAGIDNALGQVKFVIPNDLSIYLHDTNHRELFQRDMRSLSSGCVRVEKPLELASALLKGKPGWDSDKIQATLDTQKTTYVRLPENIPTYLMYWTAWVDGGGQVQFRDDIYKHDQVHFSTPKDADSLIL